MRSRPARTLRPDRALRAVACLLAVPVVGLCMLAAAHAMPASKVFLNGVPTPVFFNDGDSFRVLAGPLKDSRARLAGFNTLESYGGVHYWGDWTPHELYVNAKMATLNARRGVWTCESEMERDGYGRILWWCKDLAIDQVRKGLAHVMTVTFEGGDPDVVAAQREAIANRRGMWAHGVPEYVLTSLHSADEAWFKGRPYNRLVATSDGHSERWVHDKYLSECEHLCNTEVVIEPGVLSAVLDRLMNDEAIKPKLVGYKGRPITRRNMRSIVENYLRTGHPYDKYARHLEEELQSRFDAMTREGVFAGVKRKKGACMVYAKFLRRYGAVKAPCLVK